MACFTTDRYVDLQNSSYLLSTQKRHKICLATVYMLEVPSIIRINAEIDLLKLCDLDHKGIKLEIQIISLVHRW